MPLYDKKNFIIELFPNEIIVVGTNSEGAHYAGAAAQANRHFGLEWGVAAGMSGQTYAFPTMDGIEEIEKHVPVFFDCARRNPDKEFHVTALGCGIAGHKAEVVAPLFHGAPENCILPEEFKRKGAL